MNRLKPNQDILRKYREMGFDRHHILEAWTGCQKNEDVFLKTLLKICSRDQLRSEQRLVWDGKYAQIKRIINQTKLKKLLTTNRLQSYTFLNFLELRKKGFLLKKEFKGSRGLSLDYREEYYHWGPRNKDIPKIAKEMKGYLRRLRHLSIKFDFYSTSMIPIAPLLKSMKRNLAGLTNLKLTLGKNFRLLQEDLHSLERLFKWLGPTLKHLELDFAENKSDMNFLPEALGRIIMRNLHQLETLCLNFNRTWLPLSAMLLFLNTVCSRLPRLGKFHLQMTGSLVDSHWYGPITNLKNNLRSLVLNLDHCYNLSLQHLLIIHHNIAKVCPLLEELFVRIPNYKRFSYPSLSFIEEKLLQKLNLKTFFPEISFEKTWEGYQNMQVKEINEEMRMEDLLREFMPKGLKEEELGLFCEVLDEDEALTKEFYYFDCDEQDDILNEIYFDQLGMEFNEIEQQNEAERILQGDTPSEEEWEILDEMDQMWDWSEEERLSYEKAPSS